MEYFNIVCDSCGRGVQGITWVNGVKFCAKCYQETFGNNIKEITYVYGGNLKEHIKVIEEKDRQIAELEEQLKNALCPKFKVGQEVFYINSRNKISSGVIYNVRYDSVKGFDYYIPMLQIEDFRIKEESLFSTKEEAQAKLRELGVRK